MEDKFIKNFCRLITKEKLGGSDITKFFNVVNSLADTKKMMQVSDGEEDKFDVLVYQEEDLFAYEILLQDDISSNEGNDISEELLEEFPELDFEFEASTTV